MALRPARSGNSPGAREDSMRRRRSCAISELRSRERIGAGCPGRSVRTCLPARRSRTKIHFDASELRLIPHDLGAGRAASPPLDRAGTGFLVNYDAAVTADGSSLAASSLIEVRAFSGAASASTRFIASAGHGEQGFTRLDSDIVLVGSRPFAAADDRRPDHQRPALDPAGPARRDSAFDRLRHAARSDHLSPADHQGIDRRALDRRPPRRRSSPAHFEPAAGALLRRATACLLGRADDRGPDARLDRPDDHDRRRTYASASLLAPGLASFSVEAGRSAAASGCRAAIIATSRLPRPGAAASAG